MRWRRLAYGAVVGLLFAPTVHVGSFYFTPELALVIGNLFAYALNPRGRSLLTLERIERAAGDTYDFIFSARGRFAFQPGQYAEWTLGIDHPDNRGNRRYFTVASAPTEAAVRLGVKFYPTASAFKRALGAMIPGDQIYASAAAGSFTLPSDRRTKLAFLAGGIGITPFRSMLQDLLDRDERRPIVVLYGNERHTDVAYRGVLDAAEQRLGVLTVYAVESGATDNEYPGVIDAHLVRQAIPDFEERVFYVSGPQAMVEAVRDTLRAMGVPRSRIKLDFFPGFA
jgi:ferredoxin-NADP reductase